MTNVAEGNNDMLAAWDGAEGEHWAAHAEHYERSVTPYRQRLISAAELRPGERVLDIGCGAGRTTREAARLVAPGGKAVGVDLSRAMLARAARTARQDGQANVAFLQADAQVHDFEPAVFDVVLSQYGVMFFADSVAAFRNIRGAAAAGARLLLMVWQGLDRNEWAETLRATLASGRELPVPPPGAPGPFRFADPDVLARVLGEAGWADVSAEEVAAEFNLGPDVATSLDFVQGMGVTRTLLADLDEQRRVRALDELRAALGERLTPAGVVFPSATWLVSARAA